MSFLSYSALERMVSSRGDPDPASRNLWNLWIAALAASATVLYTGEGVMVSLYLPGCVMCRAWF